MPQSATYMLPSESTARPDGRLNCPSPSPLSPYAAMELAVGRELLYAVVPPVGDVYLPVPVERDAPGQVELAVAVAVRAEAAYELAVLRHLLHAVVAMVNQQQVVVSVECQPGWAVELALAAADRPPLGDEIAVRIIDGNALEKVVAIYR